MANTIWGSVVDGQWKVEAQQTGPGTAVLKIWNSDDQLVYEKPVTLSYGAIFGPDVDDVTQWQMKALEFIDAQGLTPSVS